MAIEIEKYIKLIVIAILAIGISATVGMLFSWNPYGIVFKIPWFLIAVFVFSKLKKIPFIWLNAIWLFVIPFREGYFATIGRLQDPELARLVYFQPKMLILHIFNYFLYVAMGYSILLWTKKN